MAEDLRFRLGTQHQSSHLFEIAFRLPGKEPSLRIGLSIRWLQGEDVRDQLAAHAGDDDRIRNLIFRGHGNGPETVALDQLRPVCKALP